MHGMFDPPRGAICIPGPSGANVDQYRPASRGPRLVCGSWQQGRPDLGREHLGGGGVNSDGNMSIHTSKAMLAHSALPRHASRCLPTNAGRSHRLWQDARAKPNSAKLGASSTEGLTVARSRQILGRVRPHSTGSGQRSIGPIFTKSGPGLTQAGPIPAKLGGFRLASAQFRDVGPTFARRDFGHIRATRADRTRSTPER